MLIYQGFFYREALVGGGGWAALCLLDGSEEVMLLTLQLRNLERELRVRCFKWRKKVEIETERTITLAVAAAAMVGEAAAAGAANMPG